MASSPVRFLALLKRISDGDYKDSILDLSNSRLDDADALALSQALKTNRYIKFLNLNNNLLKKKGAAIFANLPHLEKLSLANNKKIDFNGLAPYVENKNLKMLDLSGNILEGDDVACLAQNRTLEELILNNCDLGRTAIKALAANTNLKTLSLVGSRITDTKAEFLATNTTLMHLDLSDTHLSDKAARGFLNCTNLISFKLDNNPEVTAETKKLLVDHIENNKQRILNWQKIALLMTSYKSNRGHYFINFIQPLIDSITELSTPITEKVEGKMLKTERFVDTRFLQQHVHTDSTENSAAQYEDFKRRYNTDFAKETLSGVKACFGLTTKLDFSLYTTMESVKRYAKLHPEDRSAKILKEMAEERNKTMSEVKPTF